MEFTAGDGVKIKGKKLYVQFCGDIKIIAHRELKDYSRVIIKYQNGQFFACFITEMPIKTFCQTNKSVGLDFGLKTFVTTSDGEKIDSPKFLKRSLKRLSKAVSKRDKQVKGSKEHKANSRVVQKIFTKITNQRADFNHKLANRLVKENDVIAIEDLNIRKLSSGQISNINRTYNDVSWNQFAQMLAYKAENAGRECVKVNPRNTSKTCHDCGKIHDLTLENREMNCECGNHQCRDINAAKNILTLGLQSLEKPLPAKS
jgi:putative transposase